MDGKTKEMAQTDRLAASGADFYRDATAMNASGVESGAECGVMSQEVRSARDWLK
jgi:hypothetical protein